MNKYTRIVVILKNRINNIINGSFWYIVSFISQGFSTLFIKSVSVDEKKTKIGYEISFTRYFYKYTSPISSKDIRSEILEIEKKLDGALEGIFNGK